MRPEGIVLTVTGGKGGVGKTTVAVHLAGWFHLHGMKVVLVDCDPQQQAAGYTPAEPKSAGSFPPAPPSDQVRSGHRPKPPSPGQSAPPPGSPDRHRWPSENDPRLRDRYRRKGLSNQETYRLGHRHRIQSRWRPAGDGCRAGARCAGGWALGRRSPRPAHHAHSLSCWPGPRQGGAPPAPPGARALPRGLPQGGAHPGRRPPGPPCGRPSLQAGVGRGRGPGGRAVSAALISTVPFFPCSGCNPSAMPLSIVVMGHWLDLVARSRSEARSGREARSRGLQRKRHVEQAG